MRTYLYLNGERVAVNNLYNTNHGQYYYGSDLLGSVKFVTGQAGQELKRIEYDIFGGIYKGNSPYGLETGYTGKPYDSVTGLSDYGFRDYSPAYARFMTEDPIKDGENWFAYVGNNPVNWVDPWGLSASDGQKDNNTAVSTGFHIPGLFPTFPKVNVTNSKALNYGIAVGASALNLVSSVGNFVLSGVAYANTLVDKTIDIADKYVPSWLTLNGSVRSDIPAFEFAIAVVAPEITLYNEANKIYYQLKSAADAAEKIIPLTKSRFGHTFTEHGATTNVEYLKYRAKGSGNPIGQFLDDQAAARFIEENIKKTANGAVTLPIPENIPARIFLPDGSTIAPQGIHLVPGGGGVKTAYPVP